MTLQKSPLYLPQDVWQAFLFEVEILNARDWIITKIMAASARPIKEVLGLKIGDQKLTSEGLILNFPHGRVVRIDDLWVMSKFRDYLDLRAERNKGILDTLFLSRYGVPVQRSQLQESFKRISARMQLPYFITTRAVRWSIVSHMMIDKGASPNQIRALYGNISIPPEIIARYSYPACR